MHTGGKLLADVDGKRQQTNVEVGPVRKRQEGTFEQVLTGH
jgi:hypothetical protein